MLKPRCRRAGSPALSACGTRASADEKVLCLKATVMEMRKLELIHLRHNTFLSIYHYHYSQPPLTIGRGWKWNHSLGDITQC